jgi:hypothetical protein
LTASVAGENHQLWPAAPLPVVTPAPILLGFPILPDEPKITTWIPKASHHPMVESQEVYPWNFWLELYNPGLGLCDLKP